MIYRLLAAVLMLLVLSCAQVVSPTGGPIDNLPPLAIHYSPDSAAKNIKPDKILIQFNEYVQVRDISKEFVVSPSLKNVPDVSASGKSIIVKIKDTLEDNTTYIFDFGKSIIDITESNSAPFKYIFSTGPTIDSVYLTGKIQNALSKKAEEGFTVMLYRSLNDSVPYIDKPYYYTRASKDGRFRFSNLKPGTYKLFALKDGNGNFMPDPDEGIAFEERPLKIDSSGTDLLIESFVEEPLKHYLKKTELPYAGKILLTYSKGVGEAELTFPEEKKSAHVYLKEYSRDKDSLTIWYKNEQSDSIYFIAKTAFTSDTIDKKIPPAKSQKGVKNYTLVSNDIEGPGIIYNDDISFTGSAPIDKVDTSLIILNIASHKDTTVIIARDTSDNKRFKIKMNFVQDSMNRVTFLPGAVTFFNGNKNDTLVYTFVRRSTDTFGTILLAVENVTDHSIVEVLNEAGIVKGRMYASPGKNNEILITNLQPGNYTARMIMDKNNNRKWDTGNYIKKLKPEKVILLEKELPVKAGWDLEETWKIETGK